VAYIQSLASGGGGGKEGQQSLVNGGREEEEHGLEAGATLSEVQAHVANHWLREEGGEEEELVCRPSVLIKSGVGADLEALRALQTVPPENGVDGDMSMEDYEREEEEEETIGENSSLQDTTGILNFWYWIFMNSSGIRYLVMSVMNYSGSRYFSHDYYSCIRYSVMNSPGIRYSVMNYSGIRYSVMNSKYKGTESFYLFA
jgi:hypothetical protein